ncbi:MAG: amino acid racemase [Bacteroidota bacterium]
MITNRHIQKIGIMGGMGSHAAAWLFQKMVELSQGPSDQEYPEILVHNNTRIPDRTQAIIHGGPDPLPELLRSVEVFNQQEVDLIAIACMTAHYFHAPIQEAFRGEVINLPRYLAEHISSRYAQQAPLKVGIMATTGTLQTGIIQKELTQFGIQVIHLTGDEQEHYFMEPIYGTRGVKSGHLSDELKNRFQTQVHRLKDQGADVLLGACSEIPLIITPPSEVPYIDAFEFLAGITLERSQSAR